MSEGFSPEIKRAPDAPKAGSSSSRGEKPQQPKVEGSLNLPPRHLSETFPWPERTTYFQQRHEFIPTILPIVTQDLEKDMNFAYRDNPGITRTVATLFSRALFVQSVMEENNPTNSDTPIYVSTSNILKSRLIATTTPVFTLGEQVVEDWQQLPPKDVEQLRLKAVYILCNMNRLGRHIEMIDDVATEGILDKGYPVNSMEEWKAYEIDEEGIEQERGMVEEMGHAFYLMNAANNPVSLRGLMKEAGNYPTHLLDSDEPLPTEKAVGYIDSSLEKDGEKWVDEFMKRYYPDKEYKSLADRVK